MNKYLICFDMDGTLLNEKKKISFLTGKYLQKLQKRGCMIVLASGRPKRELKRYYDQLKLTSPLVCLNGSYCYSPFDKDFPEYEFTFDKNIAIEITEELLNKGAIDNAFCENNSCVWLYKKDPDLINFFWNFTQDDRMVFGSFRDTLDKNPAAMLAESKKGGHEKEIEEIVKKYPGLNVRFWFNGHYSELYFDGSSKAATLEKIAKFYGFKKERIIAFGDQHNDIEMLEWAGIGVAMKNASEELKEHADIVTKKDNNHNGIYHALKSIIKSNK